LERGDEENEGVNCHIPKFQSCQEREITSKLILLTVKITVNKIKSSASNNKKVDGQIKNQKIRKIDMKTCQSRSEVKNEMTNNFNCT